MISVYYGWTHTEEILLTDWNVLGMEREVLPSVNERIRNESMFSICLPLLTDEKPIRPDALMQAMRECEGMMDLSSKEGKENIKPLSGGPSADIVEEKVINASIT